MRHAKNLDIRAIRHTERPKKNPGGALDGKYRSMEVYKEIDSICKIL